MLLPAEYMKRHVELGYAVTSHRAQGITTDTAHVVVASSMTRENFYVAMTRGREGNTAYVALDQPDVAHVGPHPGNDTESTARSILHGVLQHVGAEQSAHAMIVAEQDARGSIAQLAAEYETIASAAQCERWASALRDSGLTQGQADDAIHSEAFGALTAVLRRAEVHHFNVRSLLARGVAARGFEDAQDVAAVLASRIAMTVGRDAGAGRSRITPRLVVGLIPKATGPMTSEMSRALEERSHLIEARASAVLEEALLARDTWTRQLGARPHREDTTCWRQQACTVAAYRDRYGIVGASALGPAPQTETRRRDFARARAALDTAKRLAEGNDIFATQYPDLSTGPPAVRIQI